MRVDKMRKGDAYEMIWFMLYVSIVSSLIILMFFEKEFTMAINQKDEIVYLDPQSLKLPPWADDWAWYFTKMDKQNLADSIAQEKCVLTPIIVWREENMIVDGIERYRNAIAKKMDLVPVILRDFTDLHQAKYQALIMNTARRHMTTAQKAACAWELYEMMRAGVIDDELVGNFLKLEKQIKNGKKVTNRVKSAAKIYGICSESVYAWGRILKYDDQDLIRECLEGVGDHKLHSIDKKIKKMRNAGKGSLGSDEEDDDSSSGNQKKDGAGSGEDYEGYEDENEGEGENEEEEDDGNGDLTRSDMDKPHYTFRFLNEMSELMRDMLVSLNDSADRIENHREVFENMTPGQSSRFIRSIKKTLAILDQSAIGIRDNVKPALLECMMLIKKK